MFFETTVELFNIYYKKMSSESHPSYNKQLALEVRKRLRQLSFICDKVQEHEQTIMTSVGNISVWKVAFFEMEFFVESFYYMADRIRKVLNHKTKNTFPGLKNFEAPGVCKVRNQLLAHPEDFEKISVPSIDCGGSEGPRLKIAKSDVGSEIIDPGFWVNAREFKDNLEILLRKVIDKI